MADNKKLNTVNVIETNDGVPSNLTSYPDTKEGNELAESLFSKIAQERGADNEDMGSHLENGFYEQGTFTVYLTHSN